MCGSPLIQRAYIDIETRRLCAITPASGFDWLIKGALAASDQSACLLLPAEAAGWPECWTWWRRGRTHLPQVHHDPEATGPPFPLHTGDYVVVWKDAA